MIIVFGFVFVVCLGLVRLAWELSQASAHDSPAILETPRRERSQELPAKAAESYESKKAAPSLDVQDARRLGGKGKWQTGIW
jgi:hypothetical protein